RSVEGLKELLDWADMVITDSNWLGISEDKISYGFTSPETMKLITYNNDQQDPKYRYRILSWHSYSSLFIQGLGPQVDWVRSTMNGWSDKNYSIIIGEAGFNYDYNLSDFWSGTLNNNPPDLEAYPVYGHPDLNYYDYDTVTNSGYHYIKTWLQEAEYFSTTPRVNIWTPESSNVVPLKGLGLWASTDCQLITGNYNCLMRWGLFETFDTAFRLPETYTLPSWYCYPSRTKRDLIAPMARQAVRAVREVWKEDQTGTYSTWKAGDMLENPILIAPYSLLNLTFFNRTAGTPETVYSIQDRTNDTIPDIPFTDSNGDKTYVNSPSCFPAQHPSGGDVWFKTTILGNIGCCWISCVAFRTQGLSNPKVVAAVYRKEGANLVELACDSSEEGTLIDISGGDGGTGTRDIYYYLWVEDPGPNASVSLDVNIYVD
ncbi:MAG TPA: hypothetical protein PLB62_15910, partial [Candidatus Sumerlaeota bacterium]|nr:hypothetical protein [Candidatus Sumerlaeota bacterium]